ncbi:MAG: GGDEF domain-containing protein [Gemmataceae bacterium]
MTAILPLAETFIDTTSWISTGLQTVSIALVAVLTLSLNRVIGQRFLRYWAWGWLALAIGLGALDAGFQLRASSRALYSVYWVAADLFGFLLFVGCRDFVRNQPIRGRDWWLFIVPASVGIVAPLYLTHINELFPVHAAIFGAYCLLALLQTFRSPSEGPTRIGLYLFRISLVALIVLFWHYSVLLTWITLQAPAVIRPVYMQYSSLYDSYAELMLAIAQVVLATDSVRRELADTNRQLAAATEQLAWAARTDALTGLLNRRAFDSLITDPAATPAPGCVAMLDLDNLKQLNDEHGHAVGDAALRTVARALQSRTRLGDLVFRMGGDEFLIVVPGLASSELTRRFETLDNSLLKSRLPGVSAPIDLSISSGIAEYRGPDLAIAVEKADAVMYASKQVKRKATSRVG